MSWLLLAVSIPAVIWIVLFVTVRRGKSEYAKSAKHLRRVANLSLAEAKDLALVLLGDSRYFKTELATSREIGTVGLAREARDLLARYDRIESARGPNVRIAWSDFGPAASNQRYTRIGRGMEGSDVEFELCMLADEEPLYELYPGEEPDPVFGTYQSVYHWIVAVADEAGHRSSGPTKRI
ncbi:MAG TPA: hypothetical protein PLE54_19660 [Burkholderiaceae bacterium]|nr:hypothetical protein [Burkholderiaceae bacterium]